MGQAVVRTWLHCLGGEAFMSYYRRVQTRDPGERLARSQSRSYILYQFSLHTGTG